MFIDDHRGEYGVEAICRVLPIAPSTYHHHQAVERDPELMREPAWWQEKWLRFRPVPLTPRRGCTW